MSYIYHLKPEPFEGNCLIPLNMMAKDSALYLNQVKKYIGRESLMKEVIPILNCRWNDVVHFSALDPQIVVNHLKLIQNDLTLLRPYYFKIHVKEILGKYETVIFDSKKAKFKSDFSVIQISEVCPLSEDYKELLEVPIETINCWKKAKKENDKILWFPFIPHILVKGVIDTTSFEICELKL